MVQILILVIFYWTKNYMKIYQFMTFRRNIQWLQTITRFNKIDGFIMVLDGKNKHLALFDYGLFDKTCNKIKHLISKKGVL